jgi:hypothetical protein
MSDLIERLRHEYCDEACEKNRFEAADEIERLEGDLQVTRLQRDARMASEFVVDDAVKAEIERLRAVVDAAKARAHLSDQLKRCR